MKHLILSAAMNTLLASALSAQTNAPMIPTENWLATNRETMGPNASANWMMDLDIDATELYVTKDHALMIVDRTPIIEQDGAAYLRKGVFGLGGTHLTLVGKVETVNDSVMHGTYSGLLGGTAVIMDQYIQLRHGVPVTVVRVIARVNGSAPMNNDDLQAQALQLMSEQTDGRNEPALSRN